MTEPGCAVKEAAINGEIHEDRYVSYCNILESLGEQRW
jgi:ribosome biogenesis GTPase